MMCCMYLSSQYPKSIQADRKIKHHDNQQWKVAAVSTRYHSRGKGWTSQRKAHVRQWQYDIAITHFEWRTEFGSNDSRLWNEASRLASNYGTIERMESQQWDSIRDSLPAGPRRNTKWIQKPWDNRIVSSKLAIQRWDATQIVNDSVFQISDFVSRSWLGTIMEFQ